MYNNIYVYNNAFFRCRAAELPKKRLGRRKTTSDIALHFSRFPTLSLSLSNLYLFLSRTPMINDAAIFALDTGKIRV